jgi:hypothetical protein
MQRNFSSRGEKHAEVVAARVSARRKTPAKPESGRQNVFAAWHPQVPVPTTKPGKKEGAQ